MTTIYIYQALSLRHGAEHFIYILVQLILNAIHRKGSSSLIYQLHTLSEF